MYLKIFIIFVSSTLFVFAKRKGESCLTPNEENAKCISVDDCTVIKQSLIYLEEDAIEFARKSQCGYDDGPLVCCGTLSKLTTPQPNFDLFDFEQFETATSPPVTLPTPISDINLPNRTECGQNRRENRIVGGEITSIGEFPWMVLLKYQKNNCSKSISYRCGGTLINQRYVLTAAQCLNIRGYNLTEVRLGEWMVSTEKDCEDSDEETCSDPVVDVPIIEKIPHPYYTKRDGNNDVALLLLEHKVKYSEYIRPICLPPSNLKAPPSGTEMMITGWGVTENGTQSDVKSKAKILMKENINCILAFPESVHISPNQACAGGIAGTDACYGDSGGPLMRKFTDDDGADEQWYQEGVIYKGLGCGVAGVPGLYTRMPRYINWILHTLIYP